MARKTLQPIDRIGDVLGNSLKRLELSSRLDEYGVWPIWNDVVGKTIAVNAQPEKIRNGTLFVKVTSAVWMQQLQFMKQMIAEKLNQRLKKEIVKNIFFVVGPIHSPSPPETTAAAPSAAMDHERKVDQQFLETVTDPELRQAFKRLLKSYSRRQRRQG
jgi:predicted nucleic acid-binding Zn ribbon protein